MKLLVGHAATHEFVAFLNTVAAQLPATGEPNGTRFIALAHYSIDENIKHFEPRLEWPTWTDIVSQNQSQLSKVTGLSAARFRAIYLVRLGLLTDVNDCEQVHYKRSGANCSEYALGYDIPHTNFACIPVVAVGSSIQFAR
jgi:hypothetical protein